MRTKAPGTFDVSEPALFATEQTYFEKISPEFRVPWDRTDTKFVTQVFKEYKIDCVYHAAAYSRPNGRSKSASRLGQQRRGHKPY